MSRFTSDIDEIVDEVFTLITSGYSNHMREDARDIIKNQILAAVKRRDEELLNNIRCSTPTED